MSKKFFSIRTKLGILFSVCILALVVSISVVVNIKMQSKSEQDFHTNAKAQLEHIANGIKIFFDETLNTLDMLSKNEDVRNADDTIHTHVDLTVPTRVDSVSKSPTEQKLVKLFKNIDNTFSDYVEVYLGTKWGGYATCFDGEMAAGYDPRKRGWYQLASSGNGQAMITDAFASTVGAVVVGLTKSFYDFSNNFVGNVSIEVTLTTLTDIIANSKIGDTGYVILVQEDGTILANPRHKEQNFTAMKDSGIDGFEGLLEYEGTGPDISMDGTTWVSEVYSIGNPKWKLIAFQEKSEMMSSAAAIVTSLVVVGLALLVIFCLIVISFSVKMLKPMTPINDALKLLEDGDFSNSVNINSNDEFSLLANSFNSFISKIQDTVKMLKNSEQQLAYSREKLNSGTAETVKSIDEISLDIDTFDETIKKQTESVQQTASAVNQISANIDSLDGMISNQNAAATDASSAVEELLGNIVSINKSVSKLSNSFGELESNATDGISKHEMVNEKITKIQQQSAMLAEANEVISAIAEQTNLLAMNAAIEAAHAGDAGKGFSVVADEIRKLSENSSAQSKAISQELSEIQTSIQDVVASSADAGISFKGVSEKIVETNNLVREISQAIKEQETGSKQINDALVTLNNASSQVRSASKEMSEGNKTILSEVQVLKDTTNDIDSRMDELDSKNTAMKSVQGVLTAISNELDGAISLLNESLAKFKV